MSVEFDLPKKQFAPEDAEPYIAEPESPNRYVSFCTDTLRYTVPGEDRIYANWAATAEYACEFVYNNRYIRASSVIGSPQRIQQCGNGWVWRYEHADL